MKALSIALGLVLAGAAQAQDLPLSAELELRNHRLLMDLIADDQNGLVPFETDGCSGGMSSGWQIVANLFPAFEASFDRNPPWQTCCVTHDQAYHNAGGASTARQSYDARLQADQILRSCVQETGQREQDSLAEQHDVTPEQVVSAFGVISQAMYYAVRAGGGPCSGLPWRWGFGYPNCSFFDRAAPARD